MNQVIKHFALMLGLKKLPYAQIEPAIKPVVDALNAIPGVSTVASCQGHVFRAGSFWDLLLSDGSYPYVYFKAPVNVACVLARALHESSVKEKPEIRTYWVIEGRFNADFELAFTLIAPEQERWAKHFSGRIWRYGVFRKKLDADLLALAVFLRKQSAMLSMGGL